MSIPAPPARLVDALSGKKAPEAFFKALSEADSFVADLDELCEVRTRVGELEASELLACADADDATSTAKLLIEERDELAALNDSLRQIVATVTSHRDELADWRLRVADALGLAETVEGVGFVVLVNSAEEAAEYASHYTEVALSHERECPVYCDDCEHYEMAQSCKHCNGSGCGPGTASGAYEECQWCAGDGRDHSEGYFAEACDAHADLSAERDDLAERLRDLDEAHMVTVRRLATANAQLKRMQATR